MIFISFTRDIFSAGLLPGPVLLMQLMCDVLIPLFHLFYNKEDDIAWTEKF